MNTKDFFNAVAETWDSHEPCTREQIQSFLFSCGLESKKKTLDLGCGTGVISDILLEAGCAVTALDLSEKMIEAAKKKARGQRYPLCLRRFLRLFGERIRAGRPL